MNNELIHNANYEQRVMWYLLQPEFSKQTIPIAIRLFAGVNPFFVKLYRQAWEGIQVIYQEGMIVDINSLDSYFFGLRDMFLTPEEADLLDDPSELSVFDPITQFSFIEAELEQHIELLLEVYKKRELQKLGHRLTAGNPNTHETLRIINETLIDISTLEAKEDISQYDIYSLLSKTNKELELISQNDGIIGLSTGWEDLDKYLSGIHLGEYVVIAGRPSMGKSTFAAMLGYNLACEKHKVAYISYEMDAPSIIHKYYASLMNIDSNDIRNGSVMRSEILASRLLDANNVIYTNTNNNLFIIDNWSDDSDIMVEKMSYYIDKIGIEVVIIDHLQKIYCKRVTKTGANREQEVSAISNSLQKMSRQKNVSVIQLAQLSRQCEMRTDKRPILSDLRESGSVEQNADVVLFLYRESAYTGDKTDKSLEVIVAKQRNGATGAVVMHYDLKTSRIVQRVKLGGDR